MSRSLVRVRAALIAATAVVATGVAWNRTTMNVAESAFAVVACSAPTYVVYFAFVRTRGVSLVAGALVLAEAVWFWLMVSVPWNALGMIAALALGWVVVPAVLLVVALLESASIAVWRRPA